MSIAARRLSSKVFLPASPLPIELILVIIPLVGFLFHAGGPFPLKCPDHISHTLVADTVLFRLSRAFFLLSPILRMIWLRLTVNALPDRNPFYKVFCFSRVGFCAYNCLIHLFGLGRSIYSNYQHLYCTKCSVTEIGLTFRQAGKR